MHTNIQKAGSIVIKRLPNNAEGRNDRIKIRFAPDKSVGVGQHIDVGVVLTNQTKLFMSDWIRFVPHVNFGIAFSKRRVEVLRISRAQEMSAANTLKKLMLLQEDPSRKRQPQLAYLAQIGFLPWRLLLQCILLRWMVSGHHRGLRFAHDNQQCCP